jgi:glycosyltransferase involved in cell wall biosynthesis
VSERARILLVKPVLPYPPDQGTKVVSFALLEALAPSHDVTVLARVLNPAENAYARELQRWCARVVTVWPANRRSLAARAVYRLAYTARSALTGRSLKSLYDCPGSVLAAARSLARESFDLIILEYWQLYPLQAVFDPERTVLLTHDIELLVNWQRARLEKGAFARLAAQRRARLEEREEVRAYQRARHIWALTPRDAESARRLSRERATVGVLPFGLPEARFARAALDRGPRERDSREVLFLGALGAAFNRDALEYFIRDIHPRLATIDGIRFTVVGGALPTHLSFFGALRNVEVAGFATDVGPFLERAACLVVPLRYAGGLRIRIIEALAAGLPVVASPAAVEGMALEPGRHVLVAREPAEYRAHVGRLLADPAFGAGLAEAGRARVWEVHGPAARTEGIRGAVEGLLRARGWNGRRP